MSDLHLGVDTGQKGAIAALSTVKGVQPIALMPLPMFKPTKDSRPQLDVRRLVDWVLEIYPKGDCHIWLEKCPYHMPSIGTMRSVAIAYGKLIGIFEARFPHMIVHRVDCGKILEGWQRKMLGDFTSEESKARAFELAREIWPGMEWPRSAKGGIIHDGCVDAALIAEFGRRKMEGEPMPSELVTA